MTDPWFTFTFGESVVARLTVRAGRVQTRECGCSWIRHNQSVIRFVRRCSEHREICRNLEDWEMQLHEETP